MTKIWLSFVLFAAAVLLSSALPPEKENGAYRGIAGPEANEKKFLSKRKPPGKIPGPQIVHEDTNPTPLADSEPALTALAEGGEQKEKKEEGEKNKEKMVPGNGKEKGKEDNEGQDMNKTKKRSQAGPRSLVKPYNYYREAVPDPDRVPVEE